MCPKPVIIAIDGYSSTGKSSFARLVAKRYGFTYIDSGALYRAVALYYIEQGLSNVNDLVPLLRNIDIHFGYNEDNSTTTFIGLRNVEDEIRSMSVSSCVSIIAADGKVREYVNSIIRRISADRSVVADGRDIGTTVFPNADLKIFMVADEKVRAERRHLQLKVSGKEESMESIVDNLRQRDKIDTTRAISPLVKAEDAVVLDNTEMTVEQQMQWIGKLLESKGII